MPSLHWIGKEAVVNHHHAVPFHLLRDVPELSVGEPGAGNLIVQGDNLVALKALLPYYAGQVKCIYIDPPYNTGNEGWVYNDNVNSPLIRDWLGKVVGKEAEDLSRHDKWLCMMYPRLALLRQFLREDGAIFISIDDSEVSNLRSVMDEIYGASNLVAHVIWQKSFAPRNNAPHFSNSHEFVLCYARHLNSLKFNRLPASERQKARYSNPDEDPRGVWTSGDVTVSLTSGQRGQQFQRTGKGANFYDVTTPSGRLVRPSPGNCWRFAEGRFRELDRDKRIWWGKDGSSMPRLKRFLSEIEGGLVPQTIWPYQEVGHTQEASQEIKEIFGEISGVAFPTPKTTRLVQQMLHITTSASDVVLDSFAGSGTTGHGVLALNKHDGGNRRFILVEVEPKVARDITAERVKRVVQGYTNAKGEPVAGLGGGFRFCELGEPLFDAGGQIRESVSFAELARHVYFTETGESLPRERVTKSPLIGECRGVGVYLLFNGVLGDRSANGGNVLTRVVLAKLPRFNGPKVVYASGCLLGRDRLQAERITFRQTPYEIKVA
jgi:adenine-specific DNA-methyltransferase